MSTEPLNFRKVFLAAAALVAALAMQPSGAGQSYPVEPSSLGESVDVAPGELNISQRTDQTIDGEVRIARSANGPATISFSSKRDFSGATEISIVLHPGGKRLLGELDAEGDFLRIEVLAGNGAVAAVSDEEKLLLQSFLRTLGDSLDETGRTAFARLVEFALARAPEGVPLSLHFRKAPVEPMQAAPPLCVELGVTLSQLLGEVPTTLIEQGLMDVWLMDHGWTYDRGRREICGLSYTRLCGTVGRPYRGRPGYVSILPLLDAATVHDRRRRTRMHGGNMPIGHIRLYPGNPPDAFCVGRCGPGCFGSFGDYLGNSDYTVTAECYAHDACIGEVDYDTIIPTTGTDDACADEFINAAWGYLNGAACNDAPADDVMGWWVVANEFMHLSPDADGGGRALQVWRDGKPQTVGRYFVNGKRTLGRYLAIRREETAGTTFYSGQIRTGRPVSVAGQQTSDNAAAQAFDGWRTRIHGRVYDSKSHKPLARVSVVLKGGRYDPGEKSTSTDAKGRFVFDQVHPYETYIAALSRRGYDDQAQEASVSLFDAGESYYLVKRSAVGAGFGGKDSWKYRGTTFELFQSGRLTGQGARILKESTSSPPAPFRSVQATFERVEGDTLKFDYEIRLSAANRSNAWEAVEGDCFVVYGMTVNHYRLQYFSVDAAGQIQGYNLLSDTGVFSVSVPVFADPLAQILTPLYGTVAYTVSWSKSCGGTITSDSETLSLQGLGWTLF
ncbi:carboxypeptidase regulatory-like domain-containing protein [Methylococcus mesophilus]|uniref:carboxypeptidase regulatory-like domain-containing protein n=1 Tax=Methylococcus mesophilus TaxID=2993564 RepID=UPI00224A8C93|nr:carboxypeptidase regulatory-like domain-containing protein [Methylococcus mesophilus]UZR29681.1 carboxypeptidase regulatory-like domain-containing protein [Methylococcus mesophilus]